MTRKKIYYMLLKKFGGKTKIAKGLDMDFRTLDNFINRKTTATYTTVEKIATALNLDEMEVADAD